MTGGTANWRDVAIGDCGEVITGSTPSTQRSEFWGTAVPFITPGDIANSPIVTTTIRSLSSEGAEVARLLPPGTTVVTCIGNIGRVGMTTVEAATNQQINAVIAGEEIEIRFLYYALMHPKRTQQMERAASSTTLPILNKTNFSRITIPVPPIDEQRRIIEVLDAVDTLGLEARETVAQVDLLGASLLQRAFWGEL